MRTSYFSSKHVAPNGVVIAVYPMVSRCSTHCWNVCDFKSNSVGIFGLSMVVSVSRERDSRCECACATMPTLFAMMIATKLQYMHDVVQILTDYANGGDVY